MSLIENQLATSDKDYQQMKREFDILETMMEEKMTKIKANERITVGQIVSVGRWLQDAA